MRVVTILGDSLTLVRPEAGIAYRDTYPFKLAVALGEGFVVVNKSRRANHILKLTSEDGLDEDVRYSNSDFFVIHVGIVDCAPRLFSERQVRILASIRPASLARAIIGFESKHRGLLTRAFPKVYVRPAEFEYGYGLLVEEILARTPAARVVAINIADTSKVNKARSFGFDANIKLYNQIIARVVAKYGDRVGVIDLHALTSEDPSLMLADGIHLAKGAHDVVARAIEAHIRGR